MEASSPPSFCFHLCSHERQDQRLDSDNELAFNIKQIKHTISLVEITRRVHKMIFQFYCIINK